MNTLIIFRHGDRLINTGEQSGDGPLTPKGIADVTATALVLSQQLQRQDEIYINLAVVSGSIRCAQTFAIIWNILLAQGIAIGLYDMHKDFFSTGEEDKGWNDLYAYHKKQLLEEIQAIGEKTAVLKHAGHLVKQCADRTIARIEKVCVSGHSATVLAVTHAPHDCLIGEYFSGIEIKDCLEQGKFRILRF